MTYSWPASARLLLQCAGAVLVFAGCDLGDSARAPQVLELDSARIELPDSVRLEVVALDRAQPGDIEPARLEVRVGDVVRFESRDPAGHAIGFDGTALTPEIRQFLEASGQMRSPPLVAEGTAWVISLEHAPPGSYPYTCVTHSRRGELTVVPRT